MLYARSATRWPARTLALASISVAAFLFAAGSASAFTFSNTAKITINDASAAGAVGKASAYPSVIAATGVTGNVTGVTATLNGFSHTCMTDVDAVLVSPDGLHRTVLTSDAGDCINGNTAHTPVNLTFDDTAVAKIPCDLDATGADTGTRVVSGTYLPTDFLKGTTPGPTGSCSSNNKLDDSFPAPGPGTGPFGASMAQLNGGAAAGNWSLYVVDQYTGDSGAINGGWTLNFSVLPPTVTAPAILGTPQVGQTLTAGSGTIGNGGVASWQWSRCDGTGQICNPISGATGATYTAQPGDTGATLKVKETVTTSGGTDSKDSAPTATVSAAPPSTLLPQQPNLAAVVSSRKTKSTQKVLRQGGVLAAFTSSANGNLVASGTVSVPNLAKTYRFTVVKSKVVAGNPTTVRLKLSSKALKAVKNALGKHKKLKAKITLLVTTPSGAKTTVHKTIKLSR